LAKQELMRWKRKNGGPFGGMVLSHIDVHLIGAVALEKKME
jgi:hypothetical protein